MPFESGGPQFGLRDGKIGRWVGDGTYDGQKDIFGIRILGVALETDSQDLEGDDVVLATQTTILKGTITLAFASVQFEVLQLLSGTPIQYGATYERQKITSRNPQYVGIVGQAMAAEGGGDTHLFVPKCKMTTGFQVRFENKTFSIPEITMSAVADSHFSDGAGNPLIFDIDQNHVATTPILPPVGMN